MIPWNAARWRSETYRKRDTAKPVGPVHAKAVMDSSCGSCGYLMCACKTHGTSDERETLASYYGELPWMRDIPRAQLLEWLRDDSLDYTDQARRFLPDAHPERHDAEDCRCGAPCGELDEDDEDDEPRDVNTPAFWAQYNRDREVALKNKDNELKKLADRQNEVVAAFMEGRQLLHEDPLFAIHTLDAWAVGHTVVPANAVDPKKRERALAWLHGRRVQCEVARRAGQQTLSRAEITALIADLSKRGAS